jgi:hypothetical protein
VVICEGRRKKTGIREINPIEPFTKGQPCTEARRLIYLGKCIDRRKGHRLRYVLVPRQ